MKLPTPQTNTARVSRTDSLTRNLDNQNITFTEWGDLVLNIEGAFSLSGSDSILGNPANFYMNCESFSHCS